MRRRVFAREDPRLASPRRGRRREPGGRRPTLTTRARVDGQRRERDVRFARAARQRARETRGDEAIGRVSRAGVQSDGWCGAVGLGRREPTRYLARGAESDGARAQRTRHRGHGACVSLDALQAMAPRPTSPASWAGRASANVKFQTSLFHTCFSASVSRVESRQSPGFCAAPIGRGDSANLLSTTNPNDAQSSRQSST